MDQQQRPYESTDALDAKRRASVEEPPSERTALAALGGCAALLLVLVVVAARCGDVRPEGAPDRGAVLVTGFYNFDGVENPSKVAARALNGSSVRGGRGHVVSRLLPVSSDGASWAAAALAARPRPYEAVVHLGLEETTSDLRIEIAGHNVLGEGDDGTCATAPAIQGAPCLLATTAPLERLVLVDEEWSTDAGVFFCNEAYFRTLAAVRGHAGAPPLLGARGTLVPVVFIHLPAETTATVDSYLPRLRRIIDVVAGSGVYAPPPRLRGPPAGS